MAERKGFERELDDLGLREDKAGRSREAEARAGKSLPLILAGPIVRRATPDKVWFWFACSQEVKGCQASIIPYDHLGNVSTNLVDRALGTIVLLVGDLRIVRLGERIWVVLVSAVPKSGKFPTDHVLGYDLEIDTEESGRTSKTKLSKEELKISYPPFQLPTFVIGERNRRITHGSCRRPGADARDAFKYYDEWFAITASDAFQRPASLILTGDQIYADDVAVPLFKATRELAVDVLGYVEQVPSPTGGGLVSADSYSWENKLTPPFLPGMDAKAKVQTFGSDRRKLTHRTTSPIGFTTDDGEAHLISFPEYAAMYLTVWNPELCASRGVEVTSSEELRKALSGFCRATQACRRVMANTATYMLCDDHEITDDWNLDQEWEDATKKNPLARRIIANGLAAYWAFQAWGNDPDMFDKNFIQVLSLYFDQLRKNGGNPRNVGSSPYNAEAEYEKLLLNAHWSFMAASNPKALCVDTRTRRETPARQLVPPLRDWIGLLHWRKNLVGKTAILSGKRVWPYLDRLLKRDGFRRGSPLLLVLPTPLLPHRSMMFIQNMTYSFPEERYQGDYELYSNNPRQRADLVLWLYQHFQPSALVILSGDVHHGSVVTGRYAYGASLEKIKNGEATWAVRVVQITSSPIKNEKNVAYRDKRLWTLGLTDAGNVGESVIPQWEYQHAGDNFAMHATVQRLKGNLGRETYIFEPHLCVVDMPTKPGGYVNVLFVGEKGGKTETASVVADTDNDPSKFKFTKLVPWLSASFPPQN